MKQFVIAGHRRGAYRLILFIRLSQGKGEDHKRDSSPLLFFDSQGAVVFPDDDISFVYRDKAVPGVNRQHRKPHAEIRREDFVSTQALDFIVIGPGVLYFFHQLLDKA